MVDYIKLVTTSESVANYARDNFCTLVDNVDFITGDMGQARYVGEIGNEFKVKVFQSNRVEIRGSLHKYYVQGANTGDFTYSMLCKAVKRLAVELKTSPENLFLENIEIGVNLILPFCPNIVLENVICVKSGTQFNIRKEGLRECLRAIYRHKIYNKSAQYGIPYKHILRYEIHFDKMCKLRPVKTLHDLTKIEHWIMFQEILLKHFDEIIFADFYPYEELPERERNFYREKVNKINNHRFWKKLKPKSRHDNFKRVKHLQDNFGQNKFSAQLHSMIEKKAAELRNL